MRGRLVVFGFDPDGGRLDLGRRGGRRPPIASSRGMGGRRSRRDDRWAAGAWVRGPRSRLEVRLRRVRRFAVRASRSAGDERTNRSITITEKTKDAPMHCENRDPGPRSMIGPTPRPIASVPVIRGIRTLSSPQARQRRLTGRRRRTKVSGSTGSSRSGGRLASEISGIDEGGRGSPRQPWMRSRLSPTPEPRRRSQSRSIREPGRRSASASPRRRRSDRGPRSICRNCETVLGPLGHHPKHDLGQGLGHVGPEVADVGRRRLGVPRQLVGDVAAGIRRNAGQQVVEACSPASRCRSGGWPPGCPEPARGPCSRPCRPSFPRA